MSASAAASSSASAAASSSASAAASSSASAAASSSSSSRAVQMLRSQPRWVVLVSKPVIVAADDELSGVTARGTDVVFDLHDPPKPSYVVLHPRIVATNPAAGYFADQPSGYILAADRSGLLLFRVTDPGSGDGREDLCLSNTRCRSRRGREVLTLPAVPYSKFELVPRPRRSIGLVVNPNPSYSDIFLVAQLYPRESVLLGDKLLCYSNSGDAWFVKPLLTSSAVRMHNLCAETGVLTHDGRLYWLALGYGLFVCKPFDDEKPYTDPVDLRFVPLPVELEMQGVLSDMRRTYVAQRRRVAPREGLLRYVEVRGLSYEAPEVAPPPVNPRVCMSTLVDPEAEEPAWRLEYEVPFAEVWAHESYAAAGLTPGEVPHVALVDPDNHRVVYFLQGSKLFGLDVPARRVVSCENCSVEDDREIKLRNSRPIIDALELWPRAPPRMWGWGDA